ncbi:hypothetical protein GGI35DRAFT_463651 [Trichoderma velutinum]
MLFFTTAMTTAMMLATLSYGRALDSSRSSTDSLRKTFSTKTRCPLGTWKCGDSSKPSDRIMVCDSSGTWVLSSVCAGSGCCKYASNGLPFCSC